VSEGDPGKGLPGDGNAGFLMDSVIGITKSDGADSFHVVAMQYPLTPIPGKYLQI